MTRIRWALAAIALLACTDEKSATAADQTGTRKPTGGKPPVSSGNGGGVAGEGGVISQSEGGTSACLPTGLFKRVSEKLDDTSEPRCPSPDEPTRAFFGPINAAHEVTLDGVSCTVSPDVISEDGCSQQRRIACLDGRSITSQCNVQEGGSVICMKQGSAISARCVVVAEYAPDSAWHGRCDGMWGPYTRTVEQTGAGADCPEVGSAEIEELSELAIEPGCMLEFPAPNGSCTVTAQESCDGGMGATHVCKVSADSSMVTCTVTRGDCVFDVSLVR